MNAILGVLDVNWEKVIEVDGRNGEVKVKLYVRPDGPGGMARTIYLGFIETTTIGTFLPDVLKDILL